MNATPNCRISVRVTPLLATLLVAACATVHAQTTTPPHDEYYWEHGEYGDSPESSTAVTDGNPLATTTQAATENVIQNAFTNDVELAADFDFGDPAPTTDDGAPPAPTGGDPASTSTAAAAAPTATQQLDIEASSGSYSVGSVDAKFHASRIPWSQTFNNRVSVQASLPFSITSVTDNNQGISKAKIYGFGVNAGVSYRVFIKEDKVPYRWKITPSLGLFVRDSADLNQGAWVFNAGLSSSFAYQVSPRWIINVGNSINFAWNTGRRDYPDPLRDDQQLLINGVQVFHVRGRLTYHAYVMDTRFLQDALVKNFQSYAVGVSFRLMRNRSVRASVVHEDGRDYSAWRGTLGTTWNF
jgi:hypothetical protein